MTPSPAPSGPPGTARTLAPRRSRLAGACLVAIAGSLLLWACLQPPISLQPATNDGGMTTGPVTDDGGSPAIVGLFTITGCAELTFPAGNARCIGVAPLPLRLVLLAVGANTHRFQVTAVPAFDGADGGAGDAGSPILDAGVDGGDIPLLDEASSRSETPTLLLSHPGTYLVTLGVGGPGGTASAAGTIVVLPAALGSGCSEEDGCVPGASCICGRGATTTCPGGLAHGLCTVGCDGTPCPTGTVCLDLSRSSTMVDGGVPDRWRQPTCVSPCGGDAGCRSDFLCRELPLLKPGEARGGAFAYGSACFAATPADVGASCALPDGSPDPTACAMGLCAPLGLRNVCSAACTTASDCPSSAACAVWTGPAPPAPTGGRCLARCDATHPCSDPLLACQAASSSGALGFTLPGAGVPAGTTICSPRRCSGAADCPGGKCTPLGTASFCTR